MNIKGGSTWFLRTPENKFLLLLRGNEPSIPYPNTWNFPGGTIEEGETPEETAERELYEEFEFTPTSMQKVLILFHTRKGREEHFFLVPIPSDISSFKLHEGQDMRLFTLDEVEQLNLGWWSREVLPLFRRWVGENV